MVELLAGTVTDVVAVAAVAAVAAGVDNAAGSAIATAISSAASAADARFDAPIHIACHPLRLCAEQRYCPGCRNTMDGVPKSGRVRLFRRGLLVAHDDSLSDGDADDRHAGHDRGNGSAKRVAV